MGFEIANERAVGFDYNLMLVAVVDNSFLLAPGMELQVTVS